jgi:hypothetical protein
MQERDPTRTLAHFRTRTLAELERHHRRGDLARDEYARRVDLAERAASPSELRPLIVDLVPLPSPSAEDGPAPAVTATTRDYAVAQQDVPETDFVFALMSGATRDGYWEPSDSINAVSIMGGVVLDFRDAAVLEGTTEVNCFALMGGVKVIVPPDMRVSVRGFGLMGGFGKAHRGNPAPDAPLIKVGGFALMGGVDVRVLDYDQDDTDESEG